MADIIRDAPLGQVIRWISGNRYFQYPEEKPNFQLPDYYYRPAESENGAVRDDSPVTNEKKNEAALGSGISLDKVDTHRSDQASTIEPIVSPQRTLPFTEARLEEDAIESVERAVSRPIAPSRLNDGTVLVDWYTTDDPDNPQNWGFGKKMFIAWQIMFYTFAVYCGSAIYVASEEGVMQRFGVSTTEAALGLSLYVLGYGTGPLLFSPLSEIALLGRNVPYMISFVLFVIISIPTAVVSNYPGFMVLRFLQGFLGSPCLATGGASLQDIFSLIKMPYALTGWVVAAYCGPAFGPVLSTYAVEAMGWRWSLWEIVWMAAPVLVVFLVSLPETSASNILLRRARRLRALTGDENLKSQAEISQGNMTVGAIFWDSIIKPFQIMILDPSVAFVNVYTSLIYSIYYSFFEVFPLVYPVKYGFSNGEMSLTFLCIVVSAVIGVALYIGYYFFMLEPDIMRNGLRAQETRLRPALFACFGLPVGLFLFAWTANPKIHWIVSVIGITIFGASAFVLMQCLFVYIPLSYPFYAASLFASNDFLRSALACGSILYARPLYINLGVAKGVSLLAGLASGCVIGMFLLYVYGAKLRAKSRFTVKE